MDIDSSIEIWNFFNLYIENNTLSADSYLQNRTTIYPVPSTGTINIFSSLFGEREFKIFTLNGKLLKNGVFSKSNNRIDISTIENGLYLLKIDNEVFKILKN